LFLRSETREVEAKVVKLLSEKGELSRASHQIESQIEATIGRETNAKWSETSEATKNVLEAKLYEEKLLRRRNENSM
jgi:hypothetical protein